MTWEHMLPHKALTVPSLLRGGAWGRALSQTRLWSLDRVCRSVIGSAHIKYIPQALSLNINAQAS